MSIFRDKTKNLDRGRTDFLNCYLTYFQWNEGLRCHFFPEKNSGENSKNSGEILLFIDEDIIKSIGKNAGINTNSEPYIEHFKNSVKIFGRGRCVFSLPLWDNCGIVLSTSGQGELVYAGTGFHQRWQRRFHPGAGDEGGSAAVCHAGGLRS